MKNSKTNQHSTKNLKLSFTPPIPMNGEAMKSLFHVLPNTNSRYAFDMLTQQQLDSHLIFDCKQCKAIGTYGLCSYALQANYLRIKSQCVLFIEVKHENISVRWQFQIRQLYIFGSIDN